MCLISHYKPVPLCSLSFCDRSDVDGLLGAGWQRANIRAAGDDSQTSCSPTRSRCFLKSFGSLTMYGAKQEVEAKMSLVISFAFRLDALQDHIF